MKNDLHNKNDVFLPFKKKNTSMLDNKKSQKEIVNKEDSKRKSNDFNKLTRISENSESHNQNISDNESAFKTKNMSFYATNSPFAHPFSTQLRLNSKTDISAPQKNLHQTAGSRFYQNKTKIKLTFANNLDKIKFKYSGGYCSTLYNYQLKIKNQTNTCVIIKIKCTNPNHYEIRPVSVQLQYHQICSFSIELKFNPHDLNLQTMKHDLTRYDQDKFKVCYISTQINQYKKQPQYQQGYKILPVVIQQTLQFIGTQTNLSQLKNKNKNKNIGNQKQIKQEQQMLIYKNLCQQNDIKCQKIEEKIKKIQDQDRKTIQILNYFNKTVYFMIGVVFFVFGFWLG